MTDSSKNHDSEKIKEFADMVDGVERLTKPIQDENIRLHEQLDKEKKDRQKERIGWVSAIAIVGISLIAFILLAYLTPDTTYQYQDGKEQIQSTGSEVVTQGS